MQRDKVATLYFFDLFTISTWAGLLERGGSQHSLFSSLALFSGRDRNICTMLYIRSYGVRGHVANLVELTHQDRVAGS
jgi:hypothetical protein